MTAAEPRSDVLRLLDALLDPQVSCCLLDTDPLIEEQLQTMSGVRFGPPEDADFLLALHGGSNGFALRARRGRLDYPDQGATILYLVEQLAEGTPASGIKLSGPGIRKFAYPRIVGLVEQELDQLRQANADYPLGIDAIFIDRTGQLMCLPRSTRIGVN